MARRRGFGPVIQKATARSWEAGFTEIFSLGTTAIQLGGTALTSSAGRATILRQHGLFSIHLTQGAAANDGFRGAIGIGIVQDEAFQAGVGSVPDPLTEIDWKGWMYHQFFDVRAGSATESDWLGGPSCYQKNEIDVKAMRKLDEQDDLIVVINTIETGTAVGQAVLVTRLLAQDALS